MALIVLGDRLATSALSAPPSELCGPERINPQSREAITALGLCWCDTHSSPNHRSSYALTHPGKTNWAWPCSQEASAPKQTCLPVRLVVPLDRSGNNRDFHHGGHLEAACQPHQ